VKLRQLEAHLKNHGCYLDREGANHSWWAAPSGKPRTAVPRHREIDYVTARGICRQLEIPLPEGSR
jgi:mRNA interferase HicA